MPLPYNNFLLAFSLLIVYTAGIYRLYQLNYAGIFLALSLAAITFIILKKMEKGKYDDSKKLIANSLQVTNVETKNYQKKILLAIYCLLLTFTFIVLFKSATARSIISPWQIVPWYFWLTFTASALLLVIIILKNKISLWFACSLFTIHYSLAFGVAVIIYSIGFGFDPFIHQTTEKLIALNGVVYPKPFYYLGQYGLIVSLHKLFFIPIIWLDKLLVPLLAAITLPYALYQAAKSFTADERVAKLTALFALIFPFTVFTLTTPQNLANIFLLLVILLSTKYLRQTQFLFSDYYLLITLSLAALATHPIAGIPAVLFVIFILGAKYFKNKFLLTTHSSLLILLSVIALPLAFAFTNNSLSTAPAESQPIFQLPKLFSAIGGPALGWFSDAGNFLLNLIYLYGFNIGIIIIAFITAGLIIYFKREQKIPIHCSLFTVHLLMSCALFASFVITKFINFSYLISYERSNFADRILTIAIYFALPFILLALVKFIEAILRQERVAQYLFFCFVVFLFCCSLYFSYPRFDDYNNSRSFSTSQADVDAVRWIEQDADHSDYIVLANQQVSAAGLREYGFKKYFSVSPSLSEEEGGGLPARALAKAGDDEIFYYPIPTGGQLYQYYLSMVDKQANKKTALAAADLVGADTVYFVLNNYWFGFEKILAEARISAETVQSVDEGKVFVFKYKK